MRTMGSGRTRLGLFYLQLNMHTKPLRPGFNTVRIAHFLGLPERFLLRQITVKALIRTVSKPDRPLVSVRRVVKRSAASSDLPVLFADRAFEFFIGREKYVRENQHHCHAQHQQGENVALASRPFLSAGSDRSAVSSPPTLTPRGKTCRRHPPTASAR